MLSSSCFPAFAQLLFLPWFPESPRYLLIDRGDELGCTEGNAQCSQFPCILRRAQFVSGVPGPALIFVNTARLYLLVHFGPVSLYGQRGCETRESIVDCEQNSIFSFQKRVCDFLLFNEISQGFLFFLLDEVTYLNYLLSCWIVYFSGSISHIRYFLPLSYSVVLLLEEITGT